MWKTAWAPTIEQKDPDVGTKLFSFTVTVVEDDIVGDCNPCNVQADLWHVAAVLTSTVLCGMRPFKKKLWGVVTTEPVRLFTFVAYN